VLQYRLNTAWDARDIKFFKDEGEEAGTQFDEFLWGSSYYRMDPALRSRLRELNSIAPFSFASHVSFELAELLLSQALLEGGGELRTILALLLMLNRPTVTRYEEVAAGRGWIRNKHVPYMAHTAITIDLDAVPTMRLIGTEAGEGVPRRRHEVRGHFCHDHTARDYLRIAGCIHDWQVTALDEKIPDFPIRWECAACGGKRWWKHQHERGDASRGWVSHDYNVTS
jgi:hypothetical protein